MAPDSLEDSILKVVELTSDNFLDWEAQVRRVLIIKNLKEFIEKPLSELSPPQDATDEIQSRFQLRRFQALHLIEQSMHANIRKLVASAGYDRNKDDPHQLWKVTGEVIGQKSNSHILQLQERLAQLSRSKFPSLQTFVDEAVTLRESLRYQNADYSDDVLIFAVFKGLEGHYATEITILKNDYRKGQLSWVQLIRALHDLATSEKLGTSFVASNKRTGQSSKGSETQPKERTADSSRNKKAKCDMCGFAHGNWWPECEFYEHHHPGPCFIAQPETRPAGWKMPRKMPKAKPPKPNTTNQPSTNQPSPYAIDTNTTSGLITTITENIRYVMVDSGADHHTFNNKGWFTTLTDLPAPVTMLSANGPVKITKSGTVALPVTRSDGSLARVMLYNTHYNPNCPANLVSSFRLKQDHGIVVDGITETLRFASSKVEVAKWTWEAPTESLGGHPWLFVATDYLPNAGAFLTSKTVGKPIPVETMHRRLMHAGIDRVRQACRREGIPLLDTDSWHCESCALGKSTELISRNPPTVKATAPLQLIIGDILNMKPMGYGGFNYALHLIDCYTGFQWMIFLPSRDSKELTNRIQHWVSVQETQMGLRVLGIQLDNAREFLAANPSRYFAEKGFQVRFSPPDTHQPMGRVERSHRSIMDLARTALIDANLPEMLWPYAMDNAVYVNNRLPSSANQDKMSPMETLCSALRIKCPQDIRHLRAFGCRAYVHVKDIHRPRARKMLPRAMKGHLIGYQDQSGHIYRVYIPETERVVKVRDVRFAEGMHEPNVDGTVELPEEMSDIPRKLYVDMDVEQDVTGHHNDQNAKPTIPDDLKNQMESEDPCQGLPTPESRPTPDSRTTPESTPIESAGPVRAGSSSQSIQSENQALRRNPRRANASYDQDYYRDYYGGSFVASLGEKRYAQVDEVGSHESPPVLSLIQVSTIMTDAIPKTYKEARTSDLWPEWKAAFEAQMKSFDDLHTWELVFPEPGENVLPGKWVLDIKTDVEGEVLRYRARWVVCGNYEETDQWEMQDIYAAVANSTIVRLFLWLVATEDLECHQFDICTAYLYAKIPPGIRLLVRQPTGFDDGTGRVCLLEHALYGLPRSALWWYQTLTQTLADIGFYPLQHEACLFRNAKTRVLILLYVDDLLIAAPKTTLIDNTGTDLSTFFQLKALGPVFRFLGIEIHRNREKRVINLTQKLYTKKLLSKFIDRGELSPRQTPWPAGTPHPIPNDEAAYARTSYQQQIGSLNYLAMNTRPDIAFTVNKLARGNHGPGDDFQRILKHLWRYIQGTKDFALVLGTPPGIPNNLTVYADAAFADDIQSRYSTAGHIATLGKSPIHWTSRLQNLVTTSTTEAEFVNLTPAGKTLLWLSSLMQELGKECPKPLVLFTDSRNARHTVLNPLNSARTRYIDVRYKWVIDMVRKGRFEVCHISTNEMVADGLTKGLSKEKHNAFLKMLGMKAHSDN